MSASVDDLLDQCARRSLHVNNLFQLPKGLWQCNLRDAGCYDFGQGPTAAAALLAALEWVNVRRARQPKADEPAASPVVVAPDAAEEDIFS